MLLLLAALAFSPSRDSAGLGQARPAHSTSIRSVAASSTQAAPLVAAAAALLLVLIVASFVRGSSASGTQAAHVAEVGYYEVEKALHNIAGTIEKTFVHPTKDAAGAYPSAEYRPMGQ